MAAQHIEEHTIQRGMIMAVTRNDRNHYFETYDVHFNEYVRIDMDSYVVENNKVWYEIISYRAEPRHYYIEQSQLSLPRPEALRVDGFSIKDITETE